MRSVFFLLLASSFLFAVPVEESLGYYRLLLKGADSEVPMKRFLDAWLDQKDRESLEEWLEAEAKIGLEAGSGSEARVWAKYLDHIGEQERALGVYQKVLLFEPNDDATALAVARLQAEVFDFEGALATLVERKDSEAMLLRGTCEYRLGNTEKALDLWRGILKESPKDFELRDDLVRLFQEEGLGKEARELQQKRIILEEDPLERTLHQLKLGALQLDDGLKEASLASFRQVLESSGGDSWLEREALHQLQEVFWRERDADGLRSYFSTLRAAMPDRVHLHKDFARRLLVAGQVDEGVTVFRELLGRNPGDYQLRLEFVELLAFAEKFEEAAEELQVVMKNGATKKLWLRLAELQAEFAEEELLATLEQVEALQGEGVEEMLEMARTYQRYEMEEQALGVLLAGRGLYADSREILEALAVLLIELNREEEVIALLDESLDDLADVFEGMRLYCELALQVEEYEKAWAGVRQLIPMPEDFTDLQVAVTLGLFIGQKCGLEKSISELEQARGENALCLLASLQERAGHWQKAEATLEEIEGEMGRRYRIALLKKRGDFAGATMHLRGMLGNGSPSVLRGELVDLLALQGGYQEALVEAEQWKMDSPREVLAWKKRAQIFQLLGRHSEASDELRSARNRFGKNDVELTSELAKTQSLLGRHREALRLYQHLFRTAETDDERLEFVDEMYAAAKPVGWDGELMTVLEAERAEVKDELFQLRLWARFCELSGSPGGQQEAFGKLYRRLPDDEKVLFDLVELAQKNYDLSGARQMLSEYAMRTRSVGVLQRLAKMLLEDGEVDSGLEMLSRIAPIEFTADDIEEIVLVLWKLQEHQLALSFLEELKNSVNENWRLQSLRADLLKKVDRVEDAQKIWMILLGAEEELERPATAPASSIAIGTHAGPVREHEWRQLLAMASQVVPRGGNHSTNSLRLPVSVSEVRWQSLARLAVESLREDATGKSWQSFLDTLNLQWLADVRKWGPFPQEGVQSVVVERKNEELEQTPEMRFRSLNESSEASPEEYLALATELEADFPEFANKCRLYAAFKRPEGAEKLGHADKT